MNTVNPDYLILLFITHISQPDYTRDKSSTSLGEKNVTLTKGEDHADST